MPELGEFIRLPRHAGSEPAALPASRSGRAPEGLPKIWLQGEDSRDRFRSLVPGVLRHDAQSSVIGLCSTLPGEGTTTVTSGLACALAEAHLNVAILDGRPDHGHLPAKWNAPGGSDCALMKYVEMVELGPVPDAGGAQRIRRLIGDLRVEARVVLLDLEPLKTSPQVLGLAGSLDAIYLVVEADRERREVIARSVESLTRSGHRVAGVILNKRARHIPDFLYRWL